MPAGRTANRVTIAVDSAHLWTVGRRSRVLRSSENRPWKLPPLSTSNSTSPSAGRPSPSAAQRSCPKVTEPSRCSRAGRPSPATPYWKIHDRSESSCTSWLLTWPISAPSARKPATISDARTTDRSEEFFFRTGRGSRPCRRDARRFAAFPAGRSANGPGTAGSATPSRRRKVRSIAYAASSMVIGPALTASSAARPSARPAVSSQAGGRVASMSPLTWPRRGG